MRFIVRFVGMIVLAVGTVFAVADIARSIADEASHLLTVGEAFAAMGSPIVIPADASAGVVAVISEISRWSIAITAGAIGFALLLLGRRPESRRRLVS